MSVFTKTAFDTCGTCERRVRLRPDGTAISHFDPTLLVHETCSGSGQRPGAKDRSRR